MKAKNFLLTGFVGSITYFLLGWVIYGILLAEFIEIHSGPAIGVLKSESDVLYWALILGNIFMGFFLAYVFTVIGNITSTGAGAATGAVIGFFCSSGFNFVAYGTMNTGDLMYCLIDIVSFTIMSGLVGAIIGAVSLEDKQAP